jgi:hypothetical protein
LWGACDSSVLQCGITAVSIISPGMDTWTGIQRTFQTSELRLIWFHEVSDFTESGSEGLSDSVGAQTQGIRI